MNNRSQTDTSNPLWELLAELELPLSTDQNETIHEWLDRILKPLKLYENLCHRVEMSLEEAAARALDALLDKKHRHIHVKIYLPAERQLKGNNWSFLSFSHDAAGKLFPSLPGTLWVCAPLPAIDSACTQSANSSFLLRQRRLPFGTFFLIEQDPTVLEFATRKKFFRPLAVCDNLFFHSFSVMLGNIEAPISQILNNSEIRMFKRLERFANLILGSFDIV